MNILSKIVAIKKQEITQKKRLDVLMKLNLLKISKGKLIHFHKKLRRVKFQLLLNIRENPPQKKK